MAIFKADYVKRGKDAPKRAKASIRYIQHLFGFDGSLSKQTAYRIVDIKGELYRNTAGYRSTLGKVFVIGNPGRGGRKA